MRWFRKSAAVSVFAIAIFVAGGHLIAQQTAAGDSEAALSRVDDLAQTAATLKASLDANMDLTEEQRAQAQKALDSALTKLQDARNFEAAANADAQMAASAESRARTLETEIASLQETPPPKIDPTRLELQLSEAQVKLDGLKKERDDPLIDPQARAQEQTKLNKDAADLQQKISEIDKSLATAPPEGEPVLVTQANQLDLNADRLSTERRLESIARRLELFSVEDSLNLPAQKRKSLDVQISYWTPFVETLKRKVADLRIKDAQGRIDDAAAALEAIPQSLKEQLEPVTTRAKEYAERELEVREDRRESQDRLDVKVQPDLTRIQSQLGQARSRVEQIGLTPALGLRLRRERQELESVRAIEQRMQDRFVKLEQAQFDFFDYSEERDGLDQADQAILKPIDDRLAAIERAIDPEIGKEGEPVLDKVDLEILSDLDDRLSGLEMPANSNAVEVLQQWKEKLSADRRLVQLELDRRRTNLRELEQAYGQYIVTLEGLDDTARQLIEATETYTEFINEHILWIRSDPPLFAKDSLANDGEALVWLLNGGGIPSSRFEMPIGIGKAVLTDARGKWWWWTVAIAVWLVLLVRGIRLRKLVQELSTAGQNRVQIEMKPTWEAWLATSFISATWSGLLLFVVWRLSAAAGDSEVRRWGQGMIPIGLTFLYLEFFRQTWRRGGLAESHFGWSTRLLSMLRRTARRMIIVGLPLATVIAALAAHRDDSEAYEAGAIQMIGCIVALLFVAYCLHGLLSPKRGVLREAAVEHPGGWLDRIKTLAWLVGLAVPGTLILLVALGYYYTVQQLLLNVTITVWLLLSIILVRSMLYRWLTIRHRRLRLEQLRQRRAAAADSASAADDAAASNVPEIAPAEQTDLTVIGQQTRRLVTTTLFLATVAGLWGIWGNVLPALHYLDNWVVWSDGTFLPSAEELGGAGLEQDSEIVQITVANLLWCLFITAIIFTAARNVPGLLELTVLQRLPLDASVRYAVTTLTRYVLVMLGIVLAGSSLGIGWSNVQWLIAALTVGLGFGLQEIFANFVSGVIILFEQPVRVGDIVTIDGVTGIVSRIRIRATTITDWDRKEYIVPNREFITGRLLNWTLKDTTNRVVINVGVAYGSDTDKVKEILLKVAQEHGNVLADPPPVVTFEGFGDSSLDFVVRAYLPALDQRLNTIHDLHTEIHRAFGEAGIEIPFPQRDLHMRSAPQGSFGGTGHGNGSARQPGPVDEEATPARSPDA